jgi:hypothetical protein
MQRHDRWRSIDTTLNRTKTPTSPPSTPGQTQLPASSDPDPLLMPIPLLPLIDATSEHRTSAGKP